MSPGANAKVTIIRDGKEQTVNMTIGNMPSQREAKADTNSSTDENSGPQLGLSLAPADRVDGLSGHRCCGNQVDPDGPAAEHGFKVGDVILEVDGAKVTNPG